MNRPLFLLVLSCLVLSNLLIPSCIGLEDVSRQLRCVSPNNTSTDLPGFCRRYYSHDEHIINGSMKITFLTTLNKISDMFESESYNLNPCVELMENYLCHYYFPSCNYNQTTNEIIPVCRSSCALLANNEDCSELMEFIDEELRQFDSPGNCSQTYRSYDSPLAVSKNCLSIEDTLNESVPLSCIEVPKEETCRPQIQNSFYAPGTFDSTGQLFSEFQEIISQLNTLDVCRAFLSAVICVFRFPACNETRGTILPICRDICHIVDSIIEQCASGQNFRHNPRFPAVNTLLDTFVCLQPETYYNFPVQYIETDPDICSGFIEGVSPVATMPTPMPPEITDDDDNTVAIIGAVTGGCAVIVVLAMMLIITVVCFKQKSKAKKKYTARHESFNDYGDRPKRTRHHNLKNDENLHLGTCDTEAAPYLTPLKNGPKDDTLKGSRTSMELLDVGDFLEYVKNRFSDVLLPVNTITKQGLLGKGAFGVVHKGEMTSPDGSLTAVAIKTIKSDSLNAMKDLVEESTIMKTFDHPNVLPLLGVCIDYDDEDILKIVIPFMVNGDLKTFLKGSRVSPNNTYEYPKGLSEKVLLRMCGDIAKGMQYLASNRFIHRDLAARNCMVDDFLSIKLADFGLAKDIYSTEYYRVDKHTTLPVKWMSLESLLDGYFDEKTDVWSFGVTCWEIFSLGRIPYPGVDNPNVINLLKTGYRLEQPKLCPSNMNEILTSTWLEDPDDRPKFAAIVQNLSIICDLSETLTNDDSSIKDTDDTAESNDHVN